MKNLKNLVKIIKNLKKFGENHKKILKTKTNTGR